MWYSKRMISVLSVVENTFNVTCHAAVASVHLAQVVKYSMQPKESVHQVLGFKENARDRSLILVASTINMIGGFARLGDWIVTREWIVVAAVQAVALKMLAHITGVFYYFKRALDTLDALRVIENFTKDDRAMIQLDQSMLDSLEVQKFAEWASLFSNIILGLYSGIELGALITGAVLFSPAVLNLLLTAGFVCLVGSILFRFSSGEAVSLIERYKATSEQRYSYQY